MVKLNKKLNFPIFCHRKLVNRLKVFIQTNKVVEYKVIVKNQFINLVNNQFLIIIPIII